MKIKRVYLVEFRHWRKTRPRKREPWTQSQLDLPGLPDYGPHGRPEIEARLLSNLDDDLPADVSGEGMRSHRRPKWGALLPIAPFLLIPLLLFAPRLWLVLSLAALLAAASTRIRITRVNLKSEI